MTGWIKKFEAYSKPLFARYGLAVSDVQQIIETALGGSVATQVLEGERTFNLVVKLSPRAVSDLDAIRNIPAFGSNGERLTLDSLASMMCATGFPKSGVKKTPAALP